MQLKLTFSFGFVQLQHINILTVHRSRKTYVAFTLKCTVIHSVKSAVICQSAVKCLHSLDFVYIGPHMVTYVMYYPLRRGLWVRTARKACWFAYCKIQLDVLGHPVVLLDAYCMSHTMYWNILNTRVVWVLVFSCCYQLSL